MQRKNSILSRSRRAMAMIMAIGVIVVIATIMALAINMTAESTKRTTDTYIYEQSMLLTKSATEYALLKIADSPPCSNLSYNFPQDVIYNIKIDIKYIYSNNTNCLVNGGSLYTTVSTPEQNGSVLLDVTVSVVDPNITPDPIRYFRRTIQKL